MRMYIVDNASTDGSVHSVLREYPDVTIIQMPKNMGYSMAYNLAMPYAFADGCKWVIWANYDILLEPGCLSEMIRAAESDPGIGVVGPAFISWESDAPNYYMTGNHPHLIQAMEARSATPVDVDWVEGSLLMVSRSIVETVGPLDPRFFMFWEEAEFCRRVRFSGKRVVLVPSARARHYGGMSNLRKSKMSRRDWLLARNFHIYTLTDPHRSFACNLLASARLLATNLKRGFTESPGAVSLELRAYAAALMRIGVWYRKWLHDRRHVPPEPLAKKFNGIQPEILTPVSHEAAIAK